MFSLSGMEAFEVGSSAFIKEAARRALTDSELGRVVISDKTEGARFDGVLGDHELTDWNAGEYQGVKTFAMKAGDRVGFMLVPRNTMQEIFETPHLRGSQHPWLSMTANSGNIDDFGRFVDVTGDGKAFGFGDGYGDSDYNDLIFQIEGASGDATLLSEAIDPEKEWRNSESGQELVQFVVDPLDLARNSPAEARKSLLSTSGKTYRGWVGSTDTDDYYSFSLGMRNEFNLSLDNLWANANVEVLDFDGNVVFSSANLGTTTESISGTLDSGAYRLRVFNVGDVGTPYDLNLSVKPTIEGITTTGSDAPIFISTNVSNTLINLDDFRSGNPLQGSRPEFIGIDGSGFSTVIIDTGIDLDHPFFGSDSNNDGVADRIIHHHDFADDDPNAGDVNGHGSNVSSIVASQDVTFTGIAPGANIISLKVFGDSGNGDFGAIEQALQWVVENAATFNIASVNMSLGDNGNYSTSQTLYGIDDELDELADRGVIVVSASGNDFDGTQGVAYPSADPNSLSVGAVWDGNNGGPFNWRSGARDKTTGADRITSFSQRDATLTDIFAPGAMIMGANATGGTVDMPGTSQAAPHIAGMAVLAQQLAQQELGRRLTPDEFRQFLRDTGTPIFDGDDEDDNVTNTQRGFVRADMLALANGIMGRNVDLSGSYFNVLSPSLNTGDFFTTEFAISNSRTNPSGAFDVDFYLSSNSTISTFDRYLGSYTVSNVPGNSSTGTLTTSLRLPSWEDPFWDGNVNGTDFYIGMIVDANNDVAEINESNNRNNGFLNSYDDVRIGQILVGAFSWANRFDDFTQRIEGRWNHPTRISD